MFYLNFSVKQSCGYQLLLFICSASKERLVPPLSHAGHVQRATKTLLGASVRRQTQGPQTLAGFSLRDVGGGSLLEAAWAPQHCPQHLLPSEPILPCFPSSSAKNVFETEADGKKVSGKKLNWAFTPGVPQCWLCCLTLEEACPPVSSTVQYLSTCGYSWIWDSREEGEPLQPGEEQKEALCSASAVIHHKRLPSVSYFA